MVTGMGARGRDVLVDNQQEGKTREKQREREREKRDIKAITTGACKAAFVPAAQRAASPRSGSERWTVE